MLRLVWCVSPKSSTMCCTGLI